MSVSRRGDFDEVVAAAAAAEDGFWRAAVVNKAETTVAAARNADLAAQASAARRRLSAARGRLTRAQKDGGADLIGVARRRVEDSSSEYRSIAMAVLDEMDLNNRAAADRLAKLLEQQRLMFDAHERVLEALRDSNES